MFEFSVARKYLIPQKKQLSNALITVMSVTVIALVVWLVLVFLSVTAGMERAWLQKLTSLNAPLRITPTENYYASYYYQIDAFSQRSDFTHKTISEKLSTPLSDPYSPLEDGELPSFILKADHHPDGSLKDPVKKIFSILQNFQQTYPDIQFQDFELSGALLRLHLPRKGQDNATFLTQVSYLASFSNQNPHLRSLIVPPTPQDIQHLHQLATRDPLLEFSLKHTTNLAGAMTQFSDPPPSSPPWVYTLQNKLFLPMDRAERKGIVLAKNFQESGVLLGDVGYLSYQAANLASVQEQRIPIYVAGFYDPGVLSIGNKCLLVPPSITQTINGLSNSYTLDRTLSNGIHVWFKDLTQADHIKQELHTALQKEGIAPYWNVTTFREYDFAKDLLQQFQSDKYLFTLLAGIILLVACCNIISLLVLLVNDKKKEIAILQAMGASSKSIMLIFGTCGCAMGMLSSLLGIGAALLTLHHLDTLVYLLGFLQGHEAFNVAFYGKSLPSELSSEALLFVLIVTPLFALGAGLVPAIKACRLKPSAILRSDV